MAKKSEAIAEILDVLWGETDYDYENNPIIDETLAGKVLDRLEKKIGMLAPTTYLEVFKKNDNGWQQE
jgi:hypothetical protein